MSAQKKKIKQLDVDVSPPAFVWNHYMTLAIVALTDLTFDLKQWNRNLVCGMVYCRKVSNLYLQYFRRFEFFSTNRWTDRKRCNNSFARTIYSISIHTISMNVRYFSLPA